MMNPVKKYLFNATLLLPVAWFTATLMSGVITWWHGYAIYFIYFMLTLTAIAIGWVLSGRAEKGVSLASVVFSMVFIFSCIAFNVFGLIVLFFPELKGWGDWQRCNAYSCWPNIYFQLPTEFNYWTLFIFLALPLIYGGKKFFELDMEAMKKTAYKKKEVIHEHIYYLKGKHGGNADTFDIIFKPRFLVKSEHWLHAAAIGFCVYVILPFGGSAGALGSSTAGSSNPFLTGAFFVCGYFFLCACVMILVQTYARYRLIKALEKEMGVKLKPAIYQK